jgi:hypothetical protein
MPSASVSASTETFHSSQATTGASETKRAGRASVH